MVDIILWLELSEHSIQHRFMAAADLLLFRPITLVKRNTDMKQVLRSTSPARWLLVFGLGIAAVGLLVFLGFGESFAQSQIACDGGEAKIFVAAGQISRETYGVYLVDYENKTICVYQFTPGKGRSLRLMAVRSYKYDVMLDAYNTPDDMSPAAVRKMVTEQKRL